MSKIYFTVLCYKNEAAGSERVDKKWETEKRKKVSSKGENIQLVNQKDSKKSVQYLKACKLQEVLEFWS